MVLMESHRNMGGDSVSSVAAVREAQARQRAASRNDRRRCLNCCTVGAPRSASAVARSLKDRAPLQLGNPAIFKLSHYGNIAKPYRSQLQGRSAVGEAHPEKVCPLIHGK